MLLKIPGKVKIVADALFETNVLNIVEVDHKQKMTKNRLKMEKYRILAEMKPMKFYWITTTELRRKQLAKLCEGLDYHIFTTEDIR